MFRISSGIWPKNLNKDEKNGHKKEIRKAILAERGAIDPETAALASQVICRKLMDIDIYEDAEDICLYMPYNNEVDVMLLAEVAEEQGIKPDYVVCESGIYR